MIFNLIPTYDQMYAEHDKGLSSHDEEPCSGDFLQASRT